MENFHTTADVFIVILLIYLGVTLTIGAKNLYFGTFIEKEPEVEKTEKIEPTADNSAKI